MSQSDVPRSTAYLERVPKSSARADDDLFAPVDAMWTSVEPALASVRRLLLAGGCVVVAALAGVILALTAPSWTVALPVVAAGGRRRDRVVDDRA